MGSRIDLVGITSGYGTNSKGDPPLDGPYSREEWLQAPVKRAAIVAVATRIGEDLYALDVPQSCTLTDPRYTMLPYYMPSSPASHSAEPILQFFRSDHLPLHLREVTYPFAVAANQVTYLPRNPERTTALRKLLEAKDCAVRAALYK